MIKKAIEFIEITKEFPGIVANDKVSIDILEGEIHAIIGENGAGKSTLMSMLFGMYKPTSGSIKIFGNHVNIRNPLHANEMGIGMVHQHFKLVDNFTNLENIILGSEFTKFGVLDKKTAISKIKLLQEKYGLFFDLKEKTRNSNVSTQQKVEIMKMLYKDADILIFDEPTAVLSPIEIKSLLKTIKAMQKEGKTIIFISHKLLEVKEIAKRATIIRHGKVIKTFDSLQGVEIEELSNAMVGSHVVTIKNKHVSNFDENDKILEFVSVSGKKLNSASFSLHKGEILAIAGVEGNGQEDIEYILGGLQKAKEGNIIINNMKSSFHEIKKRKHFNLSYIPGDRHKFALALDLDVKENLILSDTKNKDFFKWGILTNFKNVSKHSNDIIKRFDVRGAREGESDARSLSGGNQQKAVVGREIEKEHDILLVVQPTRGLDVGAINNIHQILLEQKAKGKAILLISYELDEILSLADTIIVLNKGFIVENGSAAEVTREKIGLAMAGKTEEVKLKYGNNN